MVSFVICSNNSFLFQHAINDKMHVQWFAEPGKDPETELFVNLNSFSSLNPVTLASLSWLQQ